MSDITSIPSVMSSATNTIRKSVDRLAQDAHVVANSSTADTSTAVEQRDVVNALVDAKQQVIYTKAAAKMIRAADEMVSSLLRAKA
jgi:hypothetical protein